MSALAVLAACASYVPKPIEPARTVEQFAARTLDAPQWRDEVARVLPQAVSNWPPREWDRATLLAVAMAANPKLRIARSEVSVASVHEDAVALAASPAMTLQSEYARREPQTWLYGVAFDFLLRTPEQKKAELDAARFGIDKAQWLWLDEVWSVRRDLVAALSDWEAARRRGEALARLDAAQARVIAIGEKRVQAGEEASITLLALRQTQLELAVQQIEIAKAKTAAQSAVAIAIGVPPSALDGLTWQWPEWGAPPTEEARLRGARELALLSRPDLAAAIADYGESEATLNQAVLRQYPQVHLQPGYYWDHGIAKWPFDVGFSLPWFHRGEIAEAHAARESAGERLLARQADIYGAIAAAERAERGAEQSLAVAEKALVVVREQQRQTRIGERLGALGTEDSAVADVLVLRAELDVQQQRAQLQGTRNALEDALHAPLSGPELDLARDSLAVAAESRR